MLPTFENFCENIEYVIVFIILDGVISGAGLECNRCTSIFGSFGLLDLPRSLYTV